MVKAVMIIVAVMMIVLVAVTGKSPYVSQTLHQPGLKPGWFMLPLKNFPCFEACHIYYIREDT